MMGWAAFGVELCVAYTAEVIDRELPWLDGVVGAAHAAAAAGLALGGARGVVSPLDR